MVNIWTEKPAKSLSINYSKAWKLFQHNIMWTFRNNNSLILLATRRLYRHEASGVGGLPVMVDEFCFVARKNDGVPVVRFCCRCYTCTMLGFK
jgi:hypothetical protein